MIGILVATHGKMAEGICDAIDVIAGEQEQLSFIGLHKGDDIDVFGAELERKINELDQGQGVIVFVDLMGASPMNRSAMLLQQNKNIEVISGVNIAGIMTAAFERAYNDNIKKVVASAIQESIDGIKDVRKLLES